LGGAFFWLTVRIAVTGSEPDSSPLFQLVVNLGWVGLDTH
jgi:hypothetical protein